MNAKTFFLAALSFACALVRADTRVWTGAGSDNNASTAANWDTGVPAADDTVKLDGDTETHENANKAMTWNLSIAPGGWVQDGYTGTVTFQCAFDAAGSGTVSVNGDVTVTSGTWTSAAGKTVDLAIDGDFSFGADAKIDLVGKGSGSRGAPSGAYDSGASHGGRGSVKATLTDAQVETAYRNKSIAACYGTVRVPYEFGSGNVGVAGGLMRFTVTGETTLDGKWYVTGGGGDSQCASGGSIILTTGTLKGAGYMQAKGGKTNSRISLGGAGRIAVTLTDPTATFDGFTGVFGAFGTDGTVTTGDTSQYDVLPKASRTTYAGAGTVYLRAGGEALDEGTLYVDNCRDDGKVNWQYSVTELNAAMDGLAFGKVVTRRGGQLRLVDGVTVETSVWSNGCKAVCDDASTVKLVGDAGGNAYVYGETSFGNLVVDSTVTTLYFESGKTFTIRKGFQATGADASHKIAIRSTAGGTAASLAVANDAYQELVFLDVKDVAGTEATLRACCSTLDASATGWTNTEITEGATVTWQGTSAAWSDTANWDLARTPVYSDRVVIPASCAAYPVLPGAIITLKDLTVAANASLELGGKPLTVTGTATVNGKLVASSADEKIVFKGATTLGAQALHAPATPVEVRLTAAASVNLGNNVFDTLTFAKGAAVTLAGGAKARVLTLEPGASLKVAQDVSLAATTFRAVGTATEAISLVAAESDGTYALTVDGVADVAYVTVGGADSSAGMTVYALDHCTVAADVVGWSTADTRYVWTGASSTAFATAANWTVGGTVASAAPGADADCVVDAGTRALAVSSATTVKSMTFTRGTATLSGALTTAKGFVFTGGTITLTQPLTVGGALVQGSGATFATTSGKSVEIAVTGDFDGQDGSVIDVSATGSGVTTGKPANNVYENGASYGGRGSLNGTYTKDQTDAFYENGDIGACYGAIYDPWSFGTSGWGGAGGGRMRVTVGGVTHLDGVWYATGGSGDSRASSGGSIILTTGTIDGAGYMQAKGGKTNGRKSLGGAGRIAVTLTEDGATFADFTGNFGAFGTDGKVSTSDTSEKAVLPSSGRTTYAGAGTVYLRAGGDAIDAGTLYIDNCRDDGKVDWPMSVTDLNASMSDLTFGGIVTRRGGQLRLLDAVTVETSVWSNGCKAVCDDASTLKLVGDAEGNAYVYGATTFANLLVDSSVENLYFEAGATFTVSGSFKAAGTDSSHRMRIRSTVDGTTYALNLANDAFQELKFLDVKDSVASGAAMTAQSSVGENCTGWTFVNVDPGEAIVWCGTTTGWGTAANWLSAKSESRVPVSTDLVTIPAGCAAYPVLPSSDITVSNLTIAAGASLTLGGNALVVNGTATVDGSLVASSAGESITFNRDVTLAANALSAALTPVYVAPTADATLALGGNSFSELTFRAGGTAKLTGGFKASTLVYEPSASVTVAQDVTLAATVFRVAATAATRASMMPALTDGTYLFTVDGFASVAGMSVGGADSSQGVTIYATDSVLADGNVKNWSLGDARFFWTGASSTDYATAANWLVGGEVPAAAPGAADDVVVTAAVRSVEIAAAGAAAKSVTLVSGALRVSGPLAVAKAFVVMDGATLTADRKVTVGGSLLAFSGATITHTAQPADEQVNWCDFDVAGDATFEAGSLVELRSRGFGCNKGPGAGSYSSGYAASFGGLGYHAPDGACYGSAFCVTNVGSGSSQSAGGGLFVLKAQGLVTFDGELRSDASYIDSYSGSGGGVWITAGRLKGKGTINCNGGQSNNPTEGGGGRVSLMLTDPGATFADFTATVTCFGGKWGTGGSYAQGAGTIYRQTGDQAFGHGTLSIVSTPSVGWTGDYYTVRASNYAEIGAVRLAADDFAHVTLDLGCLGLVRLLGDVDVAALSNETPTLEAKNYAKIDLGGHVLKVDERLHALTLDGSSAGATRAQIRAAQSTTAQIENRGELRWKNLPTMLIVK